MNIFQLGIDCANAKRSNLSFAARLALFVDENIKDGNLLSENREEEAESNRYRLLCELAISQRAKKVQKLKFISRNEAFQSIVLFPMDINLEAANNT